MNIDNNIFNLVNELENTFNILVLVYDDENDNNYAFVKIWSKDREVLLKNFYDSKVDIYKQLRGIKFGIQAVLNGDIDYE